MTPRSEMLYLSGDHEPAFAVVHSPDRATARNSAVILCPPFGWEEVCSYRARRVWAERLAESGHLCLRLSYPGTGDSAGGPRDPARVAAWTAAICSASAALRRTGDAGRVTAIGIGLGGLLVLRALADDAPIDDIVLWGTPSQGRAVIRQLRTFARMEWPAFFEGLPEPPRDDTELHAGGFLLSAETLADLNALDAAVLDLSGPPGRRALLLERDGLEADNRLQSHLGTSGFDVTVAPGPGYGDMVAHPQTARPPEVVITRVTAWLGQIARQPVQVDPSLPTRFASHIGGGPSGITETPLVVEAPGVRLSAVLAEPDETLRRPLCAVLLNAGAVHRIGPNRMWVEASRRWAADGVPTLRLDVEAIGDSDGDAAPYVQDRGLYVPELVPQVLAALDEMQRRGLGDRFFLAGLCAGAYWSLHAALDDPRISGIAMINPRAIAWHVDLEPARLVRGLLTKPRSWRIIPKLATPARVRLITRWLAAAPRRAARRRLGHRANAATQADPVTQVIDRLHEARVRTLVLFSRSEPLFDELTRSGQLERLGRAETVTIRHIDVRDHTLRPRWAQARAHAALDEALAAEARAPGSTGAPARTPRSNPGRPAAPRAWETKPTAPQFDVSTPVLVLRRSVGPFQHGVLGVARSLGRVGVPVHAVSWGPGEAAMRSRYIRGVLDLDPGLDGAAWVEQLLTLRQRFHGAVLLPIDDMAAIAIDDHHEQLADVFRVPVRAGSALRELASKRRLHEICQEIGIGSPASVVTSSVAEGLSAARSFGYPVVLKRSDPWLVTGAGKPSVCLVGNDDEARRAYEAIRGGNDGDILVQELIPGGQESVWIFNGYRGVDGALSCRFTGRKLRQSGSEAGPASLGECSSNRDVDEAAARLLEHVDYRGIVDMDFHHDPRDGAYKLLDVNPRLGSTFRLFTADNGLDVVRAMHLDLTGRSIPPATCRDGRRWIDERGDTATALALGREGALRPAQWWSSLEDVEETAWWAKDDRVPFILMCIRSMAAVPRRLRRASRV